MDTKEAKKQRQEQYLRDGRQGKWSKKYRAKYHFVNVRLEEDDYRKLKAFSEKEDISMSAYIVQLIKKDLTS